MQESGVSSDRFIELLDELNDEPMAMFNILGIGQDERAHTRMLAWLLDPNGTHGLGDLFLKDLLSKADIDLPADLETATVTTFDQQPENTELDIVIEVSKTIVCLEIKTRGHLGSDQWSRQTDYIEAVVDGSENRDGGAFDHWEYIYVTSDSSHDPRFVANRITWKTIGELITPHIGQIEQDKDVIRIREWTGTITDHLTGSTRISPSTELQLRFPSLVADFEIDVNFASVESDRQRLLSAFWNWLADAHPPMVEGTNGWADTRSRVEARTKYLRLRKEAWPDTLRFEIQATPKRLTSREQHPSTHDAYRTRNSHIEITLSYTDNPEHARDHLLDQLSRQDKQRLAEGGFNLVRDELPDSCDADRNPYHVYSKQIPFDFTCPDETIRGLQEGINILAQLEGALDSFTPPS